MKQRRYIVSFKDKDGKWKYVFRVGENKEWVHSNACREFGAFNVGGIYPDDKDGINIKYMRAKGIAEKNGSISN